MTLEALMLLRNQKALPTSDACSSPWDLMLIGGT